ncbi:MAG: DUF4412 domain-containing protein [Polyangiaceae bacterium]
MKSSKLVRSVACASFLLALGGCDKLKSAVGMGSADGGAAAASGGSLSGLEGEIDIAATAKDPGKPDKTVNVAMMVKGNKFRADLPSGIEGAEKLGKIYGIVDSDAKKAYIVLDAQKEVIELDMNKVGDQIKSMKPTTTRSAAAPGQPEPAKYPPKITKTGKTDTVAGYSCEIWDIQNTEPGDKSKADVCVAQQGVSWFHIPLTGAPAEYAALGELMDGSHFPLRGVATGKDGVTEQGRVEVTKIDKKTLDANLFVPPPTYKVVDIQQAMAGFMSQMGGPGAAGMMGGPGGAGGFGGPGGHLPPHH